MNIFSIFDEGSHSYDNQSGSDFSYQNHKEPKFEINRPPTGKQALKFVRVCNEDQENLKKFPEGYFIVNEPSSNN